MMKTKRGSNRKPGAPALPGAGRPKVFATVRLPIAGAPALLDALIEIHNIMPREHPAERGMAFLIAGLQAELAERGLSSRTKGHKDE